MVMVMSTERKIRNHRLFALLTAVFCFQLGGFVALWHSGRVDLMLRQGDRPAAEREARAALRWCLVNLFVFFGLILLSTVTAVGLVLARMS